MQDGYEAAWLPWLYDLYGNQNKHSLYRRWRWNPGGDINFHFFSWCVKAESCGFIFLLVIKVKAWKRVVFPRLLDPLNPWVVHINAELLSFISALRASKRLHSSSNWAFKMTPGTKNPVCLSDGRHPSELGSWKTSLLNPEGLIRVSGIISDNLVMCFFGLCSVLWDYCAASPQDPAAHLGINQCFHHHVAWGCWITTFDLAF